MAPESGKKQEDLDHVPKPELAPDFYIDHDEFAPFTAEVGESAYAT